MKIKSGLKWFTLGILPVASFALFGFGMPHTFRGLITPDGKQVPQTVLTATQMQQVQHSITGIGLPYGDFVRAHKLGNFPQNEVAYSKLDALKNPNTQEIVLPYGIFVRETKAQEKTQELSDPQWAPHHHFYQSDETLIQAALAKHIAQTSSTTNSLK